MKAWIHRDSPDGSQPMRLLTIILVSLFGLSNAQADKCYLTKERHTNTGEWVIYKTSSRPAPEVICQVPCTSGSQGGDYEIEVIRKNPQGKVIGQPKAWTEDYQLDFEKNEQIRCTLDESKVEARKNQRALEAQARRAKREKVSKLRQDFKAQCIEKFSEKRGRGKDFNTCLAALLKKCLEALKNSQKTL